MTKPDGRKDLMRLHRKAKALSRLPATRRDAERAVAAVLSGGSIWSSIRLSQVPLRYLTTFWNLMIEEGLLKARGDGLELTQEGKHWVTSCNIDRPADFNCRRCDRTGLDSRRGRLSTVREMFIQIASQRPAAIRKYDQGYVTEETTLARLAFAWEKGDLTGKDVIVLGDDDLVSVALALSGVCRRIVALDIDQRLIGFINRTVRSYGLTNLEAMVQDLRDPMPPSLVSQFDTFFCDPTESFLGFQVFVGRGLACLKGEGSAGYFGLTRVESSLRKWQRIQRFLLSRGAVITDIRDRFHQYANWGYVEEMRSWDWLPVKVLPEEIWYESALYRVELLRKPRVANEKVSGDIFTDEEAATT